MKTWFAGGSSATRGALMSRRIGRFTPHSETICSPVLGSYPARSSQPP
jgi:hypothetical protein